MHGCAERSRRRWEAGCRVEASCEVSAFSGETNSQTSEARQEEKSNRSSSVCGCPSGSRNMDTEQLGGMRYPRHNQVNSCGVGSPRAGSPLVSLLAVLVLCGAGLQLSAAQQISADFDEGRKNAITTSPTLCENGQRWCSRCENTTKLMLTPGADPTWITFDQIFNASDAPPDARPKNGQPIEYVRGQVSTTTFHYFEFTVLGGDGTTASDTRRDAVYFTLVSPIQIQVANGKEVAKAEYVDLMPAYDFYVGQNCIPSDGAWNNQGYSNFGATEHIKSIMVNARYFLALKVRSDVKDFSMRMSRGSLSSDFSDAQCTPLRYRYPDEITNMISQYAETGVIALELGGAAPVCGQTPYDKYYNIEYVFPTPAPGLSQRNLAILVGVVCGVVVFVALVAGMWLYVRYYRTTKRMAKFSSLSRGLPDALLDGEGQEVAV